MIDLKKVLSLAGHVGYQKGILVGLETAYEILNKSLKRKREILNRDENIKQAINEYERYLEWFLIEEGYDLEAFKNKRY